MKQLHKWVFFCNKPRLRSLSLINIFRNKIALYALLIFCSAFLFSQNGFTQATAENERPTIKMRVVAVNPSSTKEQAVPVKIYLPQEVARNDIVSSRDLEIGYDDEQSMYYAYKEGVMLRPKETRVFEVEVKDVWTIPQKTLDSLGEQTSFVIKRLEGSEYYDAAKVLANAIYDSLNVIASTQNDDTVGRKEHIGIYRNNLLVLAQIKENIERLERQLTLASALPIPEVLEKKEVKTEAPTKTTTWMIIFIIIIFLAMLAAVFFFTWHTQARSTKDYISDARKSVFKKDESS